MLRKEINEGIEWLEEQTHRLVALLVVGLLLTPVLKRFADYIHALKPSATRDDRLHEVLEMLHRIINAADVVIAVLLAVALIYRHALKKKTTLNGQELLTTARCRDH